jgi:hypothetical protein
LALSAVVAFLSTARLPGVHVLLALISSLCLTLPAPPPLPSSTDTPSLIACLLALPSTNHICLHYTFKTVTVMTDVRKTIKSTAFSTHTLSHTLNHTCTQQCLRFFFLAFCFLVALNPAISLRIEPGLLQRIIEF